MSTIDLHPAFEKEVIAPAVADVHRRWREYVDLDDLTQEARLWWYSSGQQYLAEYLTEDEHFVRLRRSVWRWCARYAEREKASRRGYHPSDLYHYTPAVIVSLLPFALDDRFTPSGGSVLDDSPAPKGNLAEGGDLLASWVDVRRAIAALPNEDQAFLSLCDDLHMDWDRIAAHTETLPDSARRRLTRLADRMSRWLNRTEETIAA